MRLTFLGTGTSFGVPQIGCGCAVCRSTDPRDKRSRSAALVEAGGVHDPDRHAAGAAAAAHRRPGLAGSMRCSTPTSTPTTSTASTISGCSRCASAGPLPGLRPARDARAAPRLASATSSTTMRAYEGTSKPSLALHAVEPGRPVDVAGVRGAPARVPARTPPGVRLPDRRPGLHHRREGHSRRRSGASCRGSTCWCSTRSGGGRIRPT